MPPASCTWLDIVAINAERWQELLRGAACCARFGVDVHEICPREAQEKWPLIQIEDVVGAIWYPHDGQCNPMIRRWRWPKAPARAARDPRKHQGGQVLVENGRAAGVETEAGVVHADVVVNCAGMWARELGASSGRRRSAARLRALLFRDRTDPRAAPDCRCCASGRMRLLQGGRRQADARRLRAGAPSPGASTASRRISASTSCLRISTISSRSSRCEFGACRCWARAGIRTFFNGPESFTPDDRYLLGEAPELAGYFVAAGFNSIGIQSRRRRRHGAGPMDRRRRAAVRSLGSRHPPRSAVPAKPRAIFGARVRDARPALCRRTCPTGSGQPPAACGARRCTSTSRRAAPCSARPPAGSAPTGSPRPGQAPRISLFLGPAELVRALSGPSIWRCGTASACST